MRDRYVVGVDVGTGSARAGVFDLRGVRMGLGSAPIKTWTPHPEWAEQSSENIWRAVCAAVRTAVEEAGASPESISGIGFDATCSLVSVDSDGHPVTVSDDGDDARNVIVWMDHRAIGEAEEINAGDYDVLRYVGGKLSPEMETPKLLWLKRHLPKSWSRAAKFFDLADYLVHRATGSETRSLCTTVCKWTYLGHEGRWDEGYFGSIGLEDALPKSGSDVRNVGEPAGQLTAQASADLGLTQAAYAGVGAIDAHAGGLGLLGAVWRDDPARSPERLESALALIGGSSSCHMAVSREPRWIPGVWGPYYGAMAPGLWLTEGGQSATGILIDYVLENHPASHELRQKAADNGTTVYEAANAVLMNLAADITDVALLTRDFHTLDYHLGNRSPVADPRARGVVDGLGLHTGVSDLAVQYLSAVQAVAYGTRAVVEAMNAGGHSITEIYAVGGGTKNPLWLQQHADALGAAIHLPEEPESVLLGAAILGATASGGYPDIPSAMQAMCRSGKIVQPNPAMKPYHDAKYKCYQSLYACQLERRKIMEGFINS